MAITASDLVKYGSANIPTDDTSTTGGAIDVTSRPLDSQWSANAVAAVISSSSGDTTQTVTVYGRLTSGATDSEGLALNGTNEVVGTKTWERVQRVSISATCAGTVTLRQGSGGTTRHTFAPGETKAQIHYQNSASEASQTVRYEKDFWKNCHGSLTLNAAKVTLTADPSSKVKIALETSKDGSGSAANRKTAPSGVGSWTDDGVAIDVPGTTLAAGERIGVWAQLTLAADDAAQKSSFTTQLQGTTT